MEPITQKFLHLILKSYTKHASLEQWGCCALIEEYIWEQTTERKENA